MNIDIRNLTKEEFEQLMNEAPETETRFIRQQDNPYEFFNSGQAVQALIIDGRPIYIAMIREGRFGRFIFWTIVNSDVKEKITLCKSARRELNKWVIEFKTIYATMEKVSKENMKWVEWLGFRVISEDNQYVTYKLGE